MKIIHYRITLLEPTLVTSLQGDPNSAVAFDYLPGSTLRGILIGKYLGSKSANMSDRELRRLFFDSTTRYLNGYPLDVYNHPSEPVPGSWHHIKDHEKEIFDLAFMAQHGRQQWEAVSAPFYTLSNEDLRLIQPTRHMTVHTQRTARFGRAMPEYRPADSQTGKERRKLLEADEIVGAVYRYDALAAGQTFQAAIICDNDDDESTLQPLIEGGAILGGSRSGGYGRAELSLISETTLSQNVTENVEDAPEGKLIITLQSDVLLRDAKGQFAVDPKLLCQVLSRHLHVTLELEDAFLDTQMVAGFNRKWGLPLPQALAMHMGSVLIVKDPGCDSTLLNSVEVRGIGERRTEGFGRIAFNRQRVLKLLVTDNTRASRRSAASIISETEAHTLAELMVSRMLRRRLDERLLVAANTVKITNPPSNAQLSRLRSILLEELRNATPDVSKIRRFIDGIQARGSARRQFERSTVNGEALLSWLKRQLNDKSEGTWTMADNDWKALLQMSDIETDIRIGTTQAKIDDALRLEYVLRFIDLLLAHAAKQRGKDN